MTSHKSNENSELKTFMANLRSGNLVQLIEANHIQYEEKCTFMCIQLKQTEEEMTKKILVLEQNSHLIEKFQNQLQELSEQNNELLEKQQVLKEENEILNSKFQSAEERFTQLDMVYDQQVSVLSERNEILETQLANLQNSQKKGDGQFDKTQTELNEMISKADKLQNELKKIEQEKERQETNFKNEILKLNELNDTFKREKIDYEERVKDLQIRLSATMDENKKLPELKNKVETLNNDRELDLESFKNEKSQLKAANDDLKSVVEDLNIKLSKKENEIEEIYLRFKQISRFGPPIPTPSESIKSSRQTKRKHTNESSDDPRPFLEESSDSDCSSVSFYKKPKDRRISNIADDGNIFKGFKNPNTFGIKQKATAKIQRSRIFEDSSIVAKKRPFMNYDQDIEIPESPVVSSSALSNTNQKL